MPIKLTKGFTLIELLIVVAIIGILAAVGAVTYNGYIDSVRKTVVERNFNDTAKFMMVEIAKCDIGVEKKVFGGLNCPVKANNAYQTCAAIHLSHKYNILNPFFENIGGAGSVAGASLGCPVKVTTNSRFGVRSGNDEVDGDVSIVVCPRNPYCNSDPGTNGKFKIMWWYDGKQMQGFKIVSPNE